MKLLVGRSEARGAKAGRRPKPTFLSSSRRKQNSPAVRSVRLQSPAILFTEYTHMLRLSWRAGSCLAATALSLLLSNLQAVQYYNAWTQLYDDSDQARQQTPTAIAVQQLKSDCEESYGG